MKVWIIPLMILGILLLSQSVYAQGVNVTLVSPENAFSVDNGSTIILTAQAENESALGLITNGTICVTYEVDEGKGLCCSPVENVSVARCEILNVPVTFGTHYWNANFTDATTSTVYYSNETRSYIGIYSDRTLLPIYPINNETVIGDNTNFIVNYTVDLYLPYDITYPLYIHFYGYSSYLGLPLFSSEKKICSIEVTANETNPRRSGLHRFGCENHMYDTYYINYEELPNYKFWVAKLKVLDQDVEGANLLSDTGFQNYMYQINTNLAHLYPPDETVYCHESGIYYYNGSLYDIREFCNYESWKDKWIPFYSYLRDDGCGGGNLTWNWRNAVNSSDYDQASLLDMPNNTEDYFQADIMISPYATNTTYYGTNLNYTAIHLIHNWTYTCANTTTYQTGNYDFWYILRVGGHNVTNVTTEYPAYPIPLINMSAIMPSFAVYWGDFFGTDIWGGLMLMALFFIMVMTILVTLNSDVVGGGSVAIFGIMVFTRIGYIHLIMMGIMLIVAGLTVVYIVRRAILSRG